MKIKETAIADLLDRVGGFWSYSIDYKKRMVYITVLNGENIEIPFDEVFSWAVERMKKQTIH
ncbi:MAG: hypothetical protein BSOLF_2917 [Candidatus Carbobacillus altaicus]|uniref:Phage protein n=1 Tax=Candidatus Carbonibacillus altaicus TaxID=2163959 RepID=A0A2R6XXR9_9BACL|nr:MAG: hypothetical protein BSOLF_2917 [Candidatus Carbobacillus altaicus]